MAAVNLTFQGMFYDKVSRVYYENATMVGIAFLSDVTIGGGPIYPPVPPPSGGGSPPSIWPNPPEGIAPHPEHPIVLPPPTQPPEGPPDDNGFVKPPPEGGGWAYHTDYGWLYSPGGGRQPHAG